MLHVLIKLYFLNLFYVVKQVLLAIHHLPSVDDIHTNEYLSS